MCFKISFITSGASLYASVLKEEKILESFSVKVTTVANGFRFWASVTRGGTRIAEVRVIASHNSSISAFISAYIFRSVQFKHSKHICLALCTSIRWLTAFRACGFTFDTSSLQSTCELSRACISTCASVTHIPLLALYTVVSVSPAHLTLRLRASCCSHTFIHTI